MPIQDPEKRRAYAAKWKAKNPDWHKNWNAKNANKIVAYGKKHYQNNRDAVLANGKKNYNKNKASVLERTRKYQQRRKQWRFDYQRKWCAENPEKRRGYCLKRRALVAGVSVGNMDTIAAWERKWRRLTQVKCYWCLEKFKPKNCHADHIKAISIGGHHTIENLCISCDSCNRRKWSKTVEDWSTQLSQPTLLV